jgi:Flp pilus assembly protein TadD
MTRSFAQLPLIALSCLGLAACATGAAVDDIGRPYDAKINAALERAAQNAGRQGSSEGSLALLEKLYKRDPKNTDSAMKFSRALRQNGELQKAQLVLEPLAQAGNASVDVMTEYANLLISLADYPAAEKAARKAAENDAKAYAAYQALGIALDAQGKYEEAETAFRTALEHWEGDPIPVMNNLALNLTNQERLPEALAIMEEAKKIAPQRIEVERNLRIIRTLNETASGRPAPRPAEKPKAKGAAPEVTSEEAPKDVSKDVTKDLPKDAAKEVTTPTKESAKDMPLVTKGDANKAAAPIKEDTKKGSAPAKGVVIKEALPVKDQKQPTLPVTEKKAE